MNKYELALVVNAKIEDDARAAVVEKAKEYITPCRRRCDRSRGLGQEKACL